MADAEERFPDHGSLWTRVVTKDYAEKWDLPIDPSFEVKYLPASDHPWGDWVVVNVPLGWVDDETNADLW